MVPDEHPEVAMQRLGALVRGAIDGEVPTRDHVAARVRLVETLEAERGSRTRRGIWAGVALLATAASAFLIFFLLMRDKPMTWTVDGVAQSGYVSAEKDARIEFSDGSEVVMEKGARGRVADVGAKKARVVLEDGRARVSVKHRPGLAFMIDCGPYGVEVTGTRFHVGWSAQVLDVRVTEGTVNVKGPHVNEVQVKEGQKLRVEGSKVELGPDVPDAPPPSGTEPLPPPTASIAPSIHVPVPPKTTWTQRVAAGEFDLVLREASDRGIDSVMSSGSLADVAALTDAARFKGRSDIAKKGLMAQRSRFASTGQGRAAAFLLGRMAEEQEHSPGAAIQWYDRYLSESPGGPFAGDALGRKMVLVSRSNGNAAAAPLAREYLKRFPSGAYASAARAIADAP
jgi:hypothetical protein